MTYPGYPTDLLVSRDRTRLSVYLSDREAQDPDFASTLLNSRSGPPSPKKLLIAFPSDPIGLVRQTFLEANDDATLIVPGFDDLETFPLFFGALSGTLSDPLVKEIDEDCSVGVFLEIARGNGPDAVYRVTGYRLGQP